MKKIILTLIVVISVVAGAMAQNDAMYVYRNDGVINGFLKSDIDSIRYSNLDLDSVEYKNYVVQEVWTVDSIYRIPLDAIDSVSFVTPKTVLKEGVIDLSKDLTDYIIGAEDLTLKIKLSTPSEIVPRVGDNIVFMNGCDALPNGFAGKVISIHSSNESMNVVCEQTYIEDIFKSFCSVQTTCGYADSNENAQQQNSKAIKRTAYNPNDLVIHLGPYTASASEDLSLAITPKSDLALKGGASISTTLAPTFRIHTFLIVGEGQGMYFSCSITGDLSVTAKASIYGGIEWQHEFLNSEFKFPIAATAGLVNFYINPGLFIRANATITSSITATRDYAFGMAFDYSSIGKNNLKPSLCGHLVSSSNDVEGSLDGSIAFGEYLETGFSVLSRDIEKICVRGEAGIQASGNFVLYNSDIDKADKETTLYERLKSSSIEVGRFVNLSLQASVLGSGVGPTWQLDDTDFHWDIVPTFENTSFLRQRSSSTQADAYTEMNGNCLFPITVGFKVLDKDNTEISDYQSTTKYTNKASILEYTFNGLSQGEQYTLYPKVNLFGHDILATPEAEIETGIPAMITSFKVTKSSYSKGAYTNDGRTYDYKFDTSVAVDIDNLDGIADWGYVYKDPYGNITRISLMEFGTSYTDTRYAYYRNEAKSTACFYPYVKYEGESECHDGKPIEYDLIYTVSYLTCPDNNHPHAIDLGLPSGTKWCCMNVGATTPEGYGGYYAWGETSEKSTYTWDNYIYYIDTDGDGHKKDKNIGSDIAGTSYDAAHINMGSSWVMPSITQQWELTNNCTREWIQQNGVEGALVTGRNGGKIFLPASGRWGEVLNYVDGIGYYWSSSLDTNDSDFAYYFYLNFRRNRQTPWTGVVTD